MLLRLDCFPILLFILCLSQNLQISSSSCSVYDSNMGATFDLTDLYRAPDQPPFIVEDGDIPCTTKVEQNFTYMFNVCGTVNSNLPKACKTISSAAGAVQINRQGTVDVNDDWCYLVGRYEDSSTVLSLINQDDPTEGMSLTYFGDYCNGGKQRKFTIVMGCSEKLAAVPQHALELAGCEYTVTMPSIYGCPVECGVANRKLCGGNGHCAYDTDASSAKCFCNNGYKGSACTESSASSLTMNYSPALLGLIITLFIIVVLLAGSIVYMARQMNSYKDDLANYQMLKGATGEEESAVV